MAESVEIFNKKKFKKRLKKHVFKMHFKAFEAILDHFFQLKKILGGTHPKKLKKHGLKWLEMA